MNKEFEKIKKAFLKKAVFKSVIIGISASLVAVGILLFAFKACNVPFNVFLYIPIGVAAAAAAGALTFFLLRPTDKKIAVKIDRTYSLNEKIQTMVEYDGQDGVILEMQRQDAGEKLASLPVRKPDLKKFWQYILIPVLAAAFFLSSVLVNFDGGNEEPPPAPPPVDEPPVDADAWEYVLALQSLMAELLVNIEDSNITEPAKTEVLAAVRGLDSTLRTVTKRGVMIETVIAAIMLIDGIVENSNSYIEISNAFIEVLGEIPENEEGDGEDGGADEEKKKTELISSAIIAGIGTVNPYIKNILTADFTYIEGLEYNLSNEIKSSLDASGFLAAASEKWDVGERDGLGELLAEYEVKLAEVLETSKLEESDALYAAVSEFKDGLVAVSGMIGKNFGDARLHEEIVSAHERLQGKLVTALKPQGYNCMMDVFIRFRLAKIFDISDDKLPELSLGLTGGNAGGDDGNGGGNGGGFGTGEENFGSDELIFNPATGEYVPYGPLLPDYDKLKAEQTDGLPDSVNAYLEEYFKILYNGIKDDNKEE